MSAAAPHEPALPGPEAEAAARKMPRPLAVPATVAAAELTVPAAAAEAAQRASAGAAGR